MAFKLTSKEINTFLNYSEGSTAVFFLLIAIRCAEQGGPQREMGILDKRANTFEKQVRWCRNTIINNVKRYEDKHQKSAYTHDKSLFTIEYLFFLASKYAPLGAANDPKDLNKNWLSNVRLFHARLLLVLTGVT